MILSICADADILSAMRIIKIIILAIRIAVPVLLIISTITSFMGAVTSGDLSSPMKLVSKRLIAAVIIFLIPSIISLTIKIVDVNNDYYGCIENATKEGVHDARVSAAKEYILNAKNTLNSGNYAIAKKAVEKVDGADRTALEAELESVKKEIDQAKKEREEAAQAAAANRDRNRNNNSNNNNNNNNNNPVVPVNGKYTKSQIIDMTEDQVRAMSNSEFMDFIGSAAQIVYAEYGGVLPSITVAQACLESGYGDHFESTSHNVYGLIGYPSNKPKVNRLRKFDNFYEATYYHAAYFKEYSNVYGNFLNACSRGDALTAAGYLSAYAGGSSSYPNSIKSLINQYNLTKYDN